MRPKKCTNSANDESEILFVKDLTQEMKVKIQPPKPIFPATLLTTALAITPWGYWTAHWGSQRPFQRTAFLPACTCSYHQPILPSNKIMLWRKAGNNLYWMWVWLYAQPATWRTRVLCQGGLPLANISHCNFLRAGGYPPYAVVAQLQ